MAHPGVASSDRIGVGLTEVGLWLEEGSEMRKAEIVRRIAEATNLTQVKAEEVVDAIFDEIKSALQQGDSIILRRFGTFDVRDKRARMGRNPKTGENAAIAARRVVRFKSGSPLKAAVNESASDPVADQL